MSDIVYPVEEFPMLIAPLVGLRVALPWKSYGSMVFLELGQLTAVDSTRRDHLVGEATISVTWDWRVEHNSSVLYGSSNTGPRIERGLSGLLGVTIASMSVAGRVPELTVSFSNGHVLRSMIMVTGEPEWMIKLPVGRWLFGRAGQLLVGEGAIVTSEDEKKAFAHAESTATRWGTPLAQPARGQCRECAWFVRLDGEGNLLDYGVCTSSESPFDRKAVACTSGCPAYVAAT
jgi:hypothetical protein